MVKLLPPIISILNLINHGCIPNNLGKNVDEVKVLAPIISGKNVDEVKVSPVISKPKVINSELPNSNNNLGKNVDEADVPPIISIPVKRFKLSDRNITTGMPQNAFQNSSDRTADEL